MSHGSMQATPVVGVTEDTFLSSHLRYPAFVISWDQWQASPESEDAALVSGIDPGEQAFFYCKVDVGDSEAVTRLTDLGFILVETAVVLEKRPLEKRGSQGESIRHARPADVGPLANIAAESFQFSRFYVDERIPGSVADDIKRAWVENFFSGERGTHMLVAEEDSVPVGFLLLIVSDNEIVIDLIAVDKGFRKRDFGRKLMEAAESEFGHVGWMTVKTQITNAPSIRFYENFGFRFWKSTYNFHLHQP